METGAEDEAQRCSFRRRLAEDDVFLVGAVHGRVGEVRDGHGPLRWWRKVVERMTINIYIYTHTLGFQQPLFY